MKKKDSRLRIRIFYGILILPTLVWLLLTAIGLSSALDSDTGENRNKHTIDEDVTLATITSEAEAWYDDRVPFRSVLLKLNSTLSYAVEVPYTKLIEPLLLQLANLSYEEDSTASADQSTTASSASPEEETTGDGSAQTTEDGSAEAEGITEGEDSASADSETDDSIADSAIDVVSNEVRILPATYETPVESGYYPYKELAPEVIQGRDNWLFSTESYPDYVGDTMPSEETLQEKLEMLVTVDQLCQEKGIEFYTFVIPNKNVVYPEYMPSVEQAEYSGMNALEDYVQTNSNVHFEYMDDELLGAKVYGQLYYKNDTHWNTRGGLAAYAYMRNTLGLSPINMYEIGSNDTYEYTGDLAVYTGLPMSAFDTEYAQDMLYRTEVTQELVSTGSDYIDEIYSSEPEVDQTVVILGDSFRHALGPYFSRDYAHMYSLNEKLMDEEMAAILNSADVIILEAVERNVFFENHYDQAIAALGAYLQQN